MQFCAILLVFGLISAVADAIFPRHASCGYESCNPTRPGRINVHIVCHTHLDTGWVETYEQYYNRYVKVIYDSVVTNLFDGPNRKFIVVETSFFSKWFNDQNETVKNRVQWLVRTGQLEITSGGWSMNDEAVTHYSAIIDQMTLGHRWLNNTFGECSTPKVAWQIDPFGHSREFASLVAQMGFDGIFLGRIDFQDKVVRERTQSMEFIWKSSPSLGQRADLFTGVLPNVYWPPKGFCFDVNCMDEPIHEANALRKAREFARLVREQLRTYATNHTIITMGMDFYYRDARKWFVNLDALMAAVNSLEAEEGVYMLYSTPACYLKSLHEMQRKWPVKLDDFFPYADAFNAYWTGYFTSRPSLKKHINKANSLLQAAKQLHVLAEMEETHANKLLPLQEILGILQHHDAATGTCKQFVANDYSAMLTYGMSTAQDAIAESFKRMWLKEGLIPTTTLSFCNNMNMSECAVTERIGHTSDVVVTIYNQLAHPVKHYARLPVKGVGFRVTDASGSVVGSQVLPIPAWFATLPGRVAQSDGVIMFRAIVPPLGFTSFIVDLPEQTTARDVSHVSQVVDGSQFRDDASISNGKLSAVFDGRTGQLKTIVLKDGRSIPLTQRFYSYRAEGRMMGEKPSGAYAFNPANEQPRLLAQQVAFKVLRGPLVEEVHQQINPWLAQVVRVYQHEDFIEFDWVVGPIPVDSWYFDDGQEIVSRYETPFQTNGTFFTDSNGRETIRRVRNHRATWDLDTTEHVASNYYPVTSWMFIRDYQQDLQMTLLPDRSEGGSSIQDGSLELMIHRRLLHDDGYGMEEALNEPGHDRRGLVVRGKHRLVLNNVQDSIRQMRMMSKSMYFKPVLTFRRRTVTNHRRGMVQHQPTARTLEQLRFIGLKKRLPANIHMLTLEPWDNGYILLRLEHFFEINEDPKYSRPKRFALNDLFTTFRIVEVKEMTLNANQVKATADARRFQWRPEFDPYANYTNVLSQPEDEGDFAAANYVVTMFPMEIKTFLLRVESVTKCVNGVRTRHGRLINC